MIDPLTLGDRSVVGASATIPILPPTVTVTGGNTVENHATTEVASPIITPVDDDSSLVVFGNPRFPPYFDPEQLPKLSIYQIGLWN